jgi:L-ascorbate metabolism protein UlaG (beta-lactamase superfamily)
MRLIRYSHSCVRLEFDGAVVVIDPGGWSEPAALVGADAVLVTHEHGDHVDESRLAGLDCPVFAPAGAALTQIDFHPVRPGGSITVAGLDVEVVGGWHAPVLAGQQRCPNVGYVIGGVYHPGDALDPALHAVDTVLVPMQASWLKTAEGVDFLQTCEYTRAIGIHDGQINERAIDSISHWYGVGSAGRYRYLPPGSST